MSGTGSGENLDQPLRWLFAVGGPLREQVVRGGIWLLIGDGLARLASLLKLVVLGRLLSPNDFGLMGIAIVLLNWLESFTQTGINAALIQRAGTIRPYLDTAWTIQVLRGLGLALALASAAPLGARFFGNPEATQVIRAIALVTLLRGFANPGVIHLRKEMNFRREVTWRLSGLVAGLLVAIPVAFKYRSVWALVASVVFAQAAETLASYWIEAYRPRLRLDWAQMRELLQFGRWFFVSNVVSFVGLYVDSLSVGKILGATALGFYQMAQQLALVPAAQLGTHLQGVIFPAFSKLQTPQSLKRAFLQTLTLVCALVVPLAWFLSIFAEELVRVVLGSKWGPISPLLRILAWAAIATAVTRVTTSLLHAAGRPDLQVRASLQEAVLVACLLYPLITTFGIRGAALAVTAAAYWSMGYQLLLVARLLEPTGLEWLGVMKIGATGSVPFLVAGLFIAHALSPSLLVIAGLTIGAYLGILGPALWFQLGLRPPRWSAPRA